MNSISARILFVLALFTFSYAGCANPQKVADSAGVEDEQLFQIPRYWEVVDEKEGETLYQANLRNNQGAGRMLIGRLTLKSEVTELQSYLYRLHTDLVDRIRGQVDLAPFSEERLVWANGIVGYRTKMRGELGRDAVIIEGVTFSDGKNAYFHYGLFPEKDYEAGRPVYNQVLTSMSPIRGSKVQKDRGFGLDANTEVTSAEVGSDGAASPGAYPSPSTHLGMASWGLTREGVTTQLGPPLRKGEHALGYRCQYVGAPDCVVVYVFEYDQLTHGAFLFEREFDSPHQYVQRYLKMTQQLSQQLGRPQQSAAIWSNPEFKNQGAKWGDALARGDVIFGTVWEMGDARIVHSLRRNDSGRIEHRILASNDRLRETAQSSAPQAAQAP